MKKIIATVGPSLLNNIKLSSLHDEKNIYRINGAHGSINDIEKYILKIKSQEPSAKILMDLPGNKVRTAGFKNGYINIEEEKKFNLSFDQMNYIDFYKYLKPNDIVWANDSIFKFKVLGIDEVNKLISFESFSTGKLDYPQYTKPVKFRNMDVPEILLCGNHELINEWRIKKSIEKTIKNRPDLMSDDKKND